MADHEWLTYKELAQRLGVGADSARIKAKRRKWPIKPGNHPSEPVRVQVPVAFLAPERSPSAPSESEPRALPNNSATAPPSAPPQPPERSLPIEASQSLASAPEAPPASVPIQVVESLQAAHREALAAVQEQHREQVATLQTAYAASQTLHLDLVGRLQAQAAAERQLFLERVDSAEIRAEAAEARAERVEHRLDQVLDVLLTERRQPAASQVGTGERKPWWRRWFGHSTRSKLGSG